MIRTVFSEPAEASALTEIGMAVRRQMKRCLFFGIIPEKNFPSWRQRFLCFIVLFFMATRSMLLIIAKLAYSCKIGTNNAYTLNGGEP